MWASQSGFAPELVIFRDEVGIKKNKKHKYKKKNQNRFKIIYGSKLDISWKETLETLNIL